MSQKQNSSTAREARVYVLFCCTVSVNMNIGIDIRVLMSSVRTGVGEYTYELLNALFQTDQTNQYFLFYNSYSDVSAVLPKWNVSNVHFVESRWPNKFLNAAQVLFGRPFIDRLNLAFVPSSGRGESGILNLDYFFSPNLNFTSLSSGTKHILTIHDLSFELFPQCYSWKRRMWHWVLRPKRQCERAHLILVPSENTKRDVVNVYGIDEKKVRVVRPGVTKSDEVRSTSDELRAKYTLPGNFFLFLATIEPRKNIVGIIEGYEEYRKKRNDPMDLIIAGPLGWKTREILNKMKQVSGVRYIGYVAPEDKEALYRAASAFVYPSLYEGFGFPVLEAFAADTPVLTSNRSSLPEVAGEAGYLVDPYAANEIALGLERLGHDRVVREWFVHKGKEQVKKFDWKQTAQDWLKSIV